MFSLFIFVKYNKYIVIYTMNVTHPTLCLTSLCKPDKSASVICVVSVTTVPCLVIRRHALLLRPIVRSDSEPT